MPGPLIVLKFGSSVLSSTARLPVLVHEIYRHYRRGEQVVAVVSAIGTHTNDLMQEAQTLVKNTASETAIAQLLSTGELRSAALLSLTLERAGVPCALLDPTEMNLSLWGDRLDGMPNDIDVALFHDTLAIAPVVVVPGFIGRHRTGGPALMGRGGSDLTAVFLAHKLNASACVLVKDVDGIYEFDPATQADVAPPKRFGCISYEDALEVADVLIQPKAIEYMQRFGKSATVSALLQDEGTTVGSFVTTMAEAPPPRRLRVLLLGLGEVGYGVYQHLVQLPEFFEVVGVLVQDLSRHGDKELPGGLISVDLRALRSRSYDVVVDACGDQTVTYDFLKESLKGGRTVVTADKRLVVDHGVLFSRLASRSATQFRFSAVTGGGTPMLEAIEQALADGGIVSLRGILNGTCNFILDQQMRGGLLADAIAEAQSLGLAEADVSRDVSGQDSEDKLRILVRAGFGMERDGFPVQREGIEGLSRTAFEQAAEKGQVIRLVASMDREGIAMVQPECLAAADFLAGGYSEDNRLVVVGKSGRIWKVSGKGAGRWPTAESLLTDLIDLHAPGMRPMAVIPTARRVNQEPVGFD